MSLSKQNRFHQLHILTILLFFTFFTSCDLISGSDDADSSFPETPEEIAQATENAKRTASEAGRMVDDAIQQAFESDEGVDADQVVKEIEKIEGINASSLNDDGTTIIVEEENGLAINIPLIQTNDERMFTRIDNSSAKSKMQLNDIISNNKTPNIKDIFPNGNKALILAPFEKDDSFSDLAQSRNRLKSAGFEVDYFANEQADLDKFRADFLAQYDIIIIDTHGYVGETIDHTKSTILTTGEPMNEERNQSLKQEELWNPVGNSDIKITPAAVSFSFLRNPFSEKPYNQTYYGISVPWLKATIGENEFESTYIYATACQTSKIDAGSASISQAFIELGAGGYSGYDADINISLKNAVDEIIIALLSSGYSLSKATEEVRTDVGLLKYVWELGILSPSIDIRSEVQLLDANYRFPNEPYYIFDPERIVGTSEVIPSTGVPGTDVVYEVKMREKFADQVDRIEFYIDTTEELIEMDQVSATLWRRDRLRAPAQPPYPTVSTFSFTAYDIDGNTMGTGAATFTNQEPEDNSTNKAPSRRKFYRGF
jgi:hypothetical protein